MPMNPNMPEQPMTAENFDHVLIGLRQRQPFRVFTVELNGGHRFEVDHPSALVVRDGVGLAQAVVDEPLELEPETVIEVEGRAVANEHAPGGVEVHEPVVRVRSISSISIESCLLRSEIARALFASEREESCDQLPI